MKIEQSRHIARLTGSLRRAAIAAVALMAAGCGAGAAYDGGDDEPVDAVDQPIIGGTAVNIQTRRFLGLVNVNGGCSGVLTHPDWVMTAAHCVGPSNNSAAAPRPNGVLETRQAIRVVRMGISDISLLELGARATDSQWPSAGHGLSFTAPATLTGRSITCYGQGATNYDSDGVGVVAAGNWRRLVRTISELDEADFILVSDSFGRETIAPGDSGGPCFLGERLVAVNSWGSWNCADRTTPEACKATITRINFAGHRSVSEFAAQISALPNWALLVALDVI